MTRPIIWKFHYLTNDELCPWKEVKLTAELKYRCMYAWIDLKAQSYVVVDEGNRKPFSANDYGMSDLPVKFTRSGDWEIVNNFAAKWMICVSTRLYIMWEHCTWTCIRSNLGWFANFQKFSFLISICFLFSKKK